MFSFYFPNTSQKFHIRVTSDAENLACRAAALPAVFLPLLLEHFLHPYYIEFLAFFLSNLFETSTFYEPIFLMEFKTV